MFLMHTAVRRPLVLPFAYRRRARERRDMVLIKQVSHALAGGKSI
jgi:hypothetical protein